MRITSKVIFARITKSIVAETPPLLKLFQEIWRKKLRQKAMCFPFA